MLSTRTLRDRSRERSSSPAVSQVKNSAKDKTTEKASTASKLSMEDWSEPSLATGSVRDHNQGSHYSAAEHMQPLGEAPSGRVKARVKADGARKSMLGRTMGVDAQETPEGTPVPQTAAPTRREKQTQPSIVVEDEHDDDYAPKVDKKKKNAAKKERARRSSGTKRPAPVRGATPPDTANPPKIVNKNKHYGPDKMILVVQAAKDRAMEVNKPDLAAAVQEIYEHSLVSERLTELLEAVLRQTATKEQYREFQEYVKAAKKKLKDAKDAKARKLPESTNGSQALPHRSPATSTSKLNNTTSALPSTEKVEPPKTTVSIKGKSNSNESNPRLTLHKPEMSTSPSKKRSGSVASDSSLTDMTSNPDDDMDVDEQDDVVGDVPGPSTRVNGLKPKDHTAERGSLAAPSRGVKRSSADAELQEDERDRILATKKQKLSETINRQYPHQESNLRGSPNAVSTRVRSLRGKNASVATPPVEAATNGTNEANSRATRAMSIDGDSSLSELSPMSSRLGTPQVANGPAKTFIKKAKTKQSPEKKHPAAYSGMPNASGAGRESPIGDDDNEEQSENNDFCSACGGSGFLLCCDGCDRSFHFSCLDPPLNEDASELNEPWYCFVCVTKRPVTSESPEKPQRGLFAPLFTRLKKSNPSNFALPQAIRDYYEGVDTDRHGAFIEAVNTRTRQRPGYGEEAPDFTKIKDGKGNTLLCYSCGKSSQGIRPIIQCDFCGENWHLDCLNPPLANPPARNQEGRKVHDWMCPLHADHELRKVDTAVLNQRGVGRKVHVRRPKNAKVVETSLRRGLRNNGVVDVIEDESDTDSEFYDEEDSDESVVYRLPASGIKLDFIDKVKNSRVQQLRSEYAVKRARIAVDAPRRLEQANFARRSFVEKQMALNLTQFASGNKDLDLGNDKVENLVGTLIAEAPPEVVEEMMTAEQDDRARSASSAIPPSPPSSEQPDQLSAEQRKQLQMLQELIRRRLESSKT